MERVLISHPRSSMQGLNAEVLAAQIVDDGSAVQDIACNYNWLE